MVDDRTRAKNAMILNAFKKDILDNDKYVTHTLKLDDLTPSHDLKKILKLINKYFKKDDEFDYLNWYEYGIKPEEVLGGRKPYPLKKFIQKLNEKVSGYWGQSLRDRFMDRLKSSKSVRLCSKYTLYCTMKYYENEVDDVDYVFKYLDEYKRHVGMFYIDFGNEMYGMLFRIGAGVDDNANGVMLVIHGQSIIGVYSLLGRPGVSNTSIGDMWVCRNFLNALNNTNSFTNIVKYNRIISELQVSDEIDNDHITIGGVYFPVGGILCGLGYGYYMLFVSLTVDKKYFVFQNYYNLKYYMFKHDSGKLKLVKIQDSIDDLRLIVEPYKHGKYLRYAYGKVGISTLKTEVDRSKTAEHAEFIKKFAKGGIWGDMTWETMTIECIEQLLKFGYLREIDEEPKGRKLKGGKNIKFESTSEVVEYKVKGLISLAQSKETVRVCIDGIEKHLVPLDKALLLFPGLRSLSSGTFYGLRLYIDTECDLA